MKCEFCQRKATTVIPNFDGSEYFNVCDFCEEEILLEEIKGFRQDQQYSENEQKIQKYLYKIHRGSMSFI
ncbi:MAG: hypothetical protein K9W44_04735 [Candidatus Lokiarchaeota archaeon]|nr:hypothetical protein [Candidatus Harpocratesius repetitus]